MVGHVEVVVVVVRDAAPRRACGSAVERHRHAGGSAWARRSVDGEARSPHTGSVRMRTPSSSSSTVECPSHVTRSPLSGGFASVAAMSAPQAAAGRCWLPKATPSWYSTRCRASSQASPRDSGRPRPGSARRPASAGAARPRGRRQGESNPAVVVGGEHRQHGGQDSGARQHVPPPPSAALPQHASFRHPPAIAGGGVEAPGKSADVRDRRRLADLVGQGVARQDPPLW